MKAPYIFSLAIVFILQFLSGTAIWAQTEAPKKVEMATKFYGEGKIYIVIAVLLIIFIGIVTYLFSLDKKITKIEQELKD